MELYDYDHVYECLPVGFFQDGSVKVKLKVLPYFEAEKMILEMGVINIEARPKKQREYIAKRVVCIEGLKVGGKEITSYEQLLQSGPNELVNWIDKAVSSTELLQAAETKNS